MSFLRDNKKLVIGFILGALFASGITVYAYTCFSSDISYTKEATNAEISVEAALDELYNKTNELENAFPNLTFVKETNVIFSPGQTTATENFTLDTGKYFLYTLGHAREYAAVFSITNSTYTPELIRSNVVSIWDTSSARGSAVSQIYKLEVNQDNEVFTLTLSSSSNTDSLGAIGRCIVFRVD